MKITASIVAKNDWSASCTQETKNNVNKDGYSDEYLTIARAVSNVVRMSKQHISDDTPYLVACIVSNIALDALGDIGNAGPDDNSPERSMIEDLYRTANNLKGHIQDCYKDGST